MGSDPTVCVLTGGTANAEPRHARAAQEFGKILARTSAEKVKLKEG